MRQSRSIIVGALVFAALCCSACQGAQEPGEPAGLSVGGSAGARGLDDGTGAPGGGATGGESGPQEPPNEAQRAQLLGHDVLGDVLRERWHDLPTSPLELARLLGSDPDCQQRDNVHMALERQTRLTGMAHRSDAAVPRAVLTGCETPEEVFVVLTSPPSAEPGADPLANNTTTEVMALDRTTGLYNFYALGRSDAGHLTLSRWLELPQGEVHERAWSASGKYDSQVDDEGGCLYCHASGTPTLLETTGDSSVWLSEPAELAYEGITQALLERTSSVVGLAEAVSEGVELVIAGQLVAGSEDSMAMGGASAGKEQVGGARGYGPRVLEGTLAGGPLRLVQSVFCPTEYQLTAVPAGKLPAQLVLDASFVPSAPVSVTWKASPVRELRRVPIRAESDVAIQQFLVKQGVLTERTVLAARLWAAGTDLSRGRCDVYWDLRSSHLEPVSEDAVEELLRKHLEQAWSERAASEARNLALKLLDTEVSSEQALGEFQASWLSAAPDRAAALDAKQVDALVVDRVSWMFSRFVPPFALNPLVYEHWLQ